MNIAIITGASSGIGEAFVRQAVKDAGFEKIWIIARREERLIKLRDDLDPERIIPLSIDLTDPGSIMKLRDELERRKPDVGLLVNCAGMGKRGHFKDTAVKASEDTLEINCKCLTKVSGICIPFMKKGSRIINIASSAAFLPQPGFAVYAASKSYVLNFSRALSYELEPLGISVTTVCPGPVKTEFLSKATDNRENDFTGFRAYFVADAEKLSEASMKAAAKGRRMLVYGFSQKALHLASKIVPTGVIMFFEKKALKQ